MSLLDFDFAAHAAERGERLTIIANVPFGISSQTLYKLLDNSEHIKRAVLVLQQEVVNRILADPSQRKYAHAYKRLPENTCIHARSHMLLWFVQLAIYCHCPNASPFLLPWTRHPL